MKATFTLSVKSTPENQTSFVFRLTTLDQQVETIQSCGVYMFLRKWGPALFSTANYRAMRASMSVA